MHRIPDVKGAGSLYTLVGAMARFAVGNNGDFLSYTRQLTLPGMTA